MQVDDFIRNFRQAFGDYELPVAVWYAEEPATEVTKTRGCFFQYLKPAREGKMVSFGPDAVACPGGKLYCGFAGMAPFIPGFVSEKERYKETPEMVTRFIAGLELQDQSQKFLHFASLGAIDRFEGIEGLIFFATPDVLTGLLSWVFFDNMAEDAVSVPFGSGCSSMVSQMVAENRRNGHRVFLGLFDPSVRPHVEANVLGLAIPLSRLQQMHPRFGDSCLSGAHAWNRVKERIEQHGIQA
ncbi:MAG: DUF169 domain-containing protein [Marinilabiliales bacterium]|nr:DUF169 domain-containing protein [Marinilabiliales bacterium]